MKFTEAITFCCASNRTVVRTVGAAPATSTMPSAPLSYMPSSRTLTLGSTTLNVQTHAAPALVSRRSYSLHAWSLWELRLPTLEGWPARLPPRPPTSAWCIFSSSFSYNSRSLQENASVSPSCMHLLPREHALFPHQVASRVKPILLPGRYVRPARPANGGLSPAAGRPSQTQPSSRKQVWTHRGSAQCAMIDVDADIRAKFSQVSL